ncbi:hypothetical protein Salat_1094800, partial [Sesamum alatum]
MDFGVNCENKVCAWSTSMVSLFPRIARQLRYSSTQRACKPASLRGPLPSEDPPHVVFGYSLRNPALVPPWLPLLPKTYLGPPSFHIESQEVFWMVPLVQLVRLLLRERGFPLCCFLGLLQILAVFSSLSFLIDRVLTYGTNLIWGKVKYL